MLTEIIREMIEASGLTYQEVAHRIGRKYSTLKRELNPNDPGAKLGADQVLALMQATGSVRPLMFLAAEMDHRLVAMCDVTPDKATLEAECLDTYPCIIDLHEAMKAGRPVEVVQELFAKAVRELEEDLVKYASERQRGARPAE